MAGVEEGRGEIVNYDNHSRVIKIHCQVWDGSGGWKVVIGLQITDYAL